MVQAHSPLWHYLSVAPRVLLAVLAFAMWRRGLRRQFPAFFSYTIFEAVGGAAIYAVYMSPSVSSATYWWSYLSFLAIEVFIKFVVIGEVFTNLFRAYPSIGRLAKSLITAAGIVLVFAGSLIAAYASPGSFWFVSATRILGRSVSVVQCGLILFLFLLAARFHLTWSRPVLGIALGLGVMASVYVAYWALLADWLLGTKSNKLDFLVMSTYHLCVLIWCYYLLVPHKSAITSAAALPENNLAAWNRELERLLQP